MNNFQSLERDCVRSAYTTDMDACKKAGVAEPIWKTEGGFVIVTFLRPNGTQDGTQGGTQDGTQGGTQGGTQDGTQGGTQDGTQDGTQGGTQGGTQDDTQGDTQGDTQDVNLDIWIESQLILRPKITTEELALLSGKGLRTIKRHIAKMPHIKYEGSGYSGHWVVLKK